MITRTKNHSLLNCIIFLIDKTLLPKFGQLVLLFALLGFSFAAFGQVYDGTYTVTSQADVDNFNYTEITGSLLIQNTDITNVDGFGELERIGGSLSIQDNTSLTNIDGFNSLVTSGSSETNCNNCTLCGTCTLFEIKGNPNLAAIDGFQNLETVAAFFRIQNNPMLNNIIGFENLNYTLTFQINGNEVLTNISNFTSLQTVPRDFFIENNVALTNISGFESLQTVRNFVIRNHINLVTLGQFGNLATVSSYFFTNNEAIITIDGFNALTTVASSFYLQQNDNLSSITGFNALIISGNSPTNCDTCGICDDCTFFQIIENPNLVTIDGFENLETVNALFRIQHNPMLNNLVGFENLSYVLNFQINGNEVLANISNFTSLQTVPRDLFIENNAVLNNIGGFESLETAGGFYIQNNIALTDISGFESLATVGNFVIQQNSNLATISQFSNLTNVYNVFNFNNNETIATIDGFNALTTVTNYFLLRQNDNLLSITGFNALITSGISETNCNTCGLCDTCTSFEINENPSLANIDGFQNLETVAAFFRIQNNPMLNNIVGFENLNYTLNFQINGNETLTNIGGFNLLTNISRAFNIIDNPSLCKFGDFTSLSSIGSVNISQNEILNNCCILNCFDVSAVTSGSVTIDNNARGCNSLNEVETLCPAEFCATPGCQIYDSSNCGCPADCPNWPQAIFLNAGWNLISFDIVPSDNSIQNVFANIISSGNLEFASSYNEGITTFNPALPAFLNNLQLIEVGFGYWVKVTNADFLPIDGLCLDDSFRKPLEAGWNLVAFPPDEPQLPQDYFGDLIANDNLEFVTGYENGIKIFNPNGPPFLNTIQQMENGFGYWIKVTNAAD